MKKQESWISVRVQTPLGLYPSFSISRDEAVLHVDDEIVFTAVKCRSFNTGKDDYYSEVEWANLEEIRFFSAINLARDREVGLCFVFPFRYTQKIEIEPATKLNDTEALELIKDLIITNLESEKSWVEPMSVPPPKYSNKSYQYNSDAFLPDLFDKLYNSIDTNDHLLLPRRLQRIHFPAKRMIL